jgi:hypothetical protein
VKLLGIVIEERGYNCPKILGTQYEGNDIYGKVTRVKCTTGMLRVTERPNQSGYLISRWMD